MPHAWIHQLSKQQLEELASQMGLPTNGTVDELRKRVKEKWTAIEAYLPSQSTDKSSPSMTSLPQRSDATLCIAEIILPRYTSVVGCWSRERVAVPHWRPGPEFGGRWGTAGVLGAHDFWWGDLGRFAVAGASGGSSWTP
jgi:hypothetical protein